MTHRIDRERLVFVCMRLGAAMALGAGLSLKELRHLAELSYFQRVDATRDRREEVREILGIGNTKIAAMAHQLREQFLNAEREYGLPRQLLALLWATPQTMAQIQKELGPCFEPDEIERAMAELIAQERVKEIPGRTLSYAPASEFQRLQVLPWRAMLDGLVTLMDHVAQAIEARFERGDEAAMVRNVSFQVDESELDALRVFYETQMLPLIVELDGRAHTGKPVQVNLSVLWSPKREQSEE